MPRKRMESEAAAASSIRHRRHCRRHTPASATTLIIPCAGLPAGGVAVSGGVRLQAALMVFRPPLADDSFFMQPLMRGYGQHGAIYEVFGLFFIHSLTYVHFIEIAVFAL